MEAKEIINLIQLGESSEVQFKERLTSATKLNQELVAFSNTKGGKILVGVNDKTGEINGLSFQDIAKHNELVSNATTNNVKPAITVLTEVVPTEAGSVMVITVAAGGSKPYKDNAGAIWIKNGSDKRKVLDNQEISRLLQQSKVMFADEMLVEHTSTADINQEYYDTIYTKKYEKSLRDAGVSLEQSLENQQLAREGKLTLTGLLAFSDKRAEYRPLCTIKCLAVDTLDLASGLSYIDREFDFSGKLTDVYWGALDFINRNIRKVPADKESFNSPTVWEIPKQVFEEVLVNALVHRDYFINACIQVVMYPDRVEIQSPGVLPNSQTIQTITSGVSIPRNPVLQSLAQYVLPYTGAGTGLMRAQKLWPNMQLVNDAKANVFKVILPKP